MTAAPGPPDGFSHRRPRGDGVMTLIAHQTPVQERPRGGHDLSSMIASEAEGLLRRGAYLALRDVECEARGDRLYLFGLLPSHYLKRVAQAVAGEVEGVCGVVNPIEVIAAPGRPGVG